jgi:phosphoglycerol transferase MdoB-like AlkP superfamily enzyme
MNGWDRFIAQLKQDLTQWLFFMLSLSLFRMTLVVWFRDKIEHTTPWTDIVNTFLNGMRYDGMAATYWILIPFLLSQLCRFVDLQALADRVRSSFGAAFSVLTAILAVVTIIYFKEYNDQFNHFVFNLYYDDTRAILSTIWTGYPVISGLLAISALTALLLALQRRLMQRNLQPTRHYPLIVRILFSVVVVLLVLVALRGSYGHRPAKLEDAAVTKDPFLNKAVLNPYIALTYAYGTHQKLANTTSGLEAFIPDRDVRKAAQSVFHTTASINDLDGYLKKTAAGHSNRTPKQIFLVVMESYDAWPLMEKYASLGLTRELASLAKNGIWVTDFLPASDGTATSLTAIISGLPDANVVTNYQQSSRTAYASSIAESFKRLGYRTRFFYGGYLSWQKLGDFVTAQGFEEVYGAAHIGTWASHNEWGVEDEALFDFIVRTVGAAPERPSLNVIMTTSYHPPYELDVYGKGFPLHAIPEKLANEFDNSVTLKMLGHLWYADRSIGEFVRKAERAFEAPLFAFTGDHYGRKFINTHPGPFERSAVPFILYGRDVLRAVDVPKQIAGSHIDIGPTLIELTASRGFSYYALGSNILDRKRPPLGVGRDLVVGPGFLADVYAASPRFYPLPGKELPQHLPDMSTLRSLHHNLHGIGWWRIARGPLLDASPSNTLRSAATSSLRAPRP